MHCKLLKPLVKSGQGMTYSQEYLLDSCSKNGHVLKLTQGRLIVFKKKKCYIACLCYFMGKENCL